MKLGDLLEKVRCYYVDRLVEAIAEQYLEKHPGLALEQAHVGSEGEEAADGRLELPLRVDIVVLDDEGVADRGLTVETQGILDFEPVDFEWEGGMDVHLSAFQWNWCELALGGLGHDPDWTPLRFWFMRWYHLPPEPAPEQGLKGVVHFLTDPEEFARGVWLAVDLGSATTRAFGELLDALKGMGVREVRIGLGLREPMRGLVS